MNKWWVKSLVILGLILSINACSSGGDCSANCNGPTGIPTMTNVAIKSIILSPVAASGGGSPAPNQWQVSQNKPLQTMIITYANVTNTNIANFTLNTSNLSSGYSLLSNTCSNAALTANSVNSCVVVLNISTITTGERDLLLTNLTGTWTGQTTPQASIWANPNNSLAQQTSVFVNITNSPITNVTVQSIILRPVAVSGGGWAAPNQWQVGQNTASQTMVITYSNVGNTNATNFTANTSSLSSGYSLLSNTCTNAALTANSVNTCVVVLNIATTTVGEKDLLLSNITGTWTGQSTPQASVWLNPLNNFIPQTSVFVNVTNAPITNVTVQSIVLNPAAVSGSGLVTPNQWQVGLNTASQTMVITYSNVGNTNATNYTVNTSSLSSGYSLRSNTCINAALTANSVNTCIVVLNISTTTAGEVDLLLSNITGTWTGQSTPQASVWLNPLNAFTAQSTVFVNITNTPLANVTVQSIILSPAAVSGNGTVAPSQWQVALNTASQTMVIVYSNVGNANTNFTLNTSNLSSGYTLASNGCNNVTLTASSGNACTVTLNVSTATAGEEDLLLTNLTGTWTGQSTPQPSVWLNPNNLFIPQSSVFVNINAAIIPPVVLTPAIFGSAGVTNTGLSIITGDVDTTSTLSSITGFPPGVITGSFFAAGSAQATAAFNQAQTKFTSAFALLPACLATGAPPLGQNLTGLDLGSVGPLTGGVYCFSSTAGLTGTLVLSGGPLATYTFLVSTGLTTATASKVSLTNGTLKSNVFWGIGSAASFGTGTSFVGIVDAQTAITDAGFSTLLGNAWVLTGAVSLITTTVTP